MELPVDLFARILSLRRREMWDEYVDSQCVKFNDKVYKLKKFSPQDFTSTWTCFAFLKLGTKQT